MNYHRDALNAGRDFFKRLQPFADQRKLQIAETRDDPLASETRTNTMGIVLVSLRNGRSALDGPTSMTSGLTRTNSLASVVTRCALLSPERTLNSTLRPSIQPNCCNAF